MANEAIGRRYSLAYKEQGSYDATDTGTSGFVAVKAAADFTPALEVFQRADQGRSGHFQLSPVPGSTHGGTLNVKLPLQAVTVSAANPVANFLSVALKQLLGGQVISGYAAAAVGGGDEGQVDVDNGILSTVYKAGAGVIVKDSDGNPMLGAIASVTDGGAGSHTLALRADMAGSPGGADDATYGTVATYLSDGAPTALTFRYQTSNAAGLLILGGCICTAAKAALGAKGDPMVDLTFSVNDVREDVSGAVLAADAFTAADIKPATQKNRALFRIGATLVSLHTLDMEATMELTPVLSHNARTGVIDMVPTDRRVKITYSRIVTGAFTDLTTLANPSGLFLSWGSAIGSVLGFSLPSPILMGPADAKVDANLWTQTRTVEAGQYTGDTGSDASADAPFAFYQG